MWTTSFLPLCTGCECFLPGDSPAAGAGRCGNPQHFPPCPQARCLFAQVIHRLVHRMVSQQNSRRLAHRRHVPAWQPRHPNLNCSRSPQAAIEGPEEMHLHLHGVNARWPSRLPSPSSLGSTCPARRSRHRGHPRCRPGRRRCSPRSPRNCSSCNTGTQDARPPGSQNSQIYAHHEHQHQLHLPLRAARMRV